jgi:predicted transcriptional regulator
MSNKRKQGELESEILGCLWDRPEGLTSQQILAMLGDDDLAITTVLTVLSRLSDKGMVHREQASGRTFLFKSAESREQHAAKLILRALGGVQSPELVLTALVGDITSDQLKFLKQVLANG